MAYRPDSDLEFLSECPSTQLDPLVQLLMFDRDHKKRHTEEISNDSRFIKHNPDHVLYWELIAEELQKFGANSLMTVLRNGKGVLYKEILVDVCKRMKVKFSKKDDVKTIEEALLLKVMIDAIEKMTDEERKVVVDELNLKTTAFTAQAVIFALQASLGTLSFLSIITLQFGYLMLS